MDIQKSFDKSLVSPYVADSIIDISEMSIDDLLDNELVKSIPIVKTIAGIIKTGINVRDKLFLKKILSFLQNIDEIPILERKKIIKEINDSQKNRVRVGEKLLYLIDSCDDHTHAENVARLFTAMLKNKIKYRQYIDAAQIIARISQDELDQFLNSHNVDYLDDSAINLGHTGLVYTETGEVEVEIEKVEQTSWKDAPEHYTAKTHGGHTTVRSTHAGDTIFEIFGVGKERRRHQIKVEHEKQKIKLRDQYADPGARR